MGYYFSCIYSKLGTPPLYVVDSVYDYYEHPQLNNTQWSAVEGIMQTLNYKKPQLANPRRKSSVGDTERKKSESFTLSV